MSGLVTGEAVALGVQTAKLPTRALAVMVDLVVFWSVYLAVLVGLAVATVGLDEAAAAAVAVAAYILVLVGVPVAVETLSRGRSPGKLLFGLRVVRDDGGPVRFRQALVRGAVGVFELQASMGVVACVASLVSARGRRLGDVFAGTLVVRERVPVRAAAGRSLPAPPPWLAGHFEGVDLSAVPDGLWLAVRQYLSRTGQLDPAAAWSTGVRLADDLVARSGAPVPQGVHPAAFLAAALAERQSRERAKAGGAPEAGRPSVVVPQGGSPSAAPPPPPSPAHAAAPPGPSAPPATGVPGTAGTGAGAAGAGTAEAPRATGFAPPA
ncbi:RDD family protein [Streptomyces thermolineatus]|uniref:RDD family protein n=1 Tax=Streptomyces thermolineatus TaxID=44033 RepID=UPI00384E08A1